METTPNLQKQKLYLHLFGQIHTKVYSVYIMAGLVWDITKQQFAVVKKKIEVLTMVHQRVCGVKPKQVLDIKSVLIVADRSGLSKYSCTQFVVYHSEANRQTVFCSDILPI